MRRTVIGVMGPGKDLGEKVARDALELGRLVARNGWALLTGGRNAGVMDLASRGAQEEGGLTIGVLPDGDAAQVSEYVDIAVVTGMGSARNNINVLSSDVVIACGLGAGTASEICLALKASRPVILLDLAPGEMDLFMSLGGDLVYLAADPAEAAELARAILAEGPERSSPSQE